MKGFADRPRGNPQSKSDTIHDGNVNEKAIDYDETMITKDVTDGKAKDAAVKKNDGYGLEING